jgi:oligoendopeptidase F
MTYTAGRWTLDELLPSADAAEIEKSLKAIERRVKKVEGWRKRLKPSLIGKDFAALLGDYEALQRALLQLYYFVSLRFAADTQDQATLALLGQVQQQLAYIENRVLFFSLWWKALDDRQAQRLMKAAGDAGYWLEEMRHFKPHTLSEAEEKIVNLKDVNGVRALETVYDTITNKFVYHLDVDGEHKELTRDELGIYVRDPRPEMREAAYRAQYRVFSDNATVLAQIYSHIVRDWRTENVELRKFKKPMSARNLSNDLPDGVVDTLLKVVHDNAPVFQRYFRAKARMIGVEKLRRYDLYAPLSHSDKSFSYDAAVNIVVDTFGQFSPRVGALAGQVFEAGHVDAEVRHGKQHGAFCASVFPGVAPWVLVNFNGRANDVATLAHEMGHAIHALLAGEHSVMTFHPGLPLAETASVFGERLVIERLLAEEPDAGVRRDLLATSLDDAYATVGRQGFFALWEKEVHELIHQGKTAEEIAARYLETLHEQFGDAIEMNDDFRWEWIAIHHFYQVPFYVYAYAFGQLLVLALYKRYKQEGESFKPKYLKILSYGGSKAPAEVLREAGINIKSAAFWQGGYDVINELIDELERLQGEAQAAA